MSDSSSPAAHLGNLAINGSPSSEASDMAAMAWRQDEPTRKSASSQHASSSRQTPGSTSSAVQSSSSAPVQTRRNERIRPSIEESEGADDEDDDDSPAGSDSSGDEEAPALHSLDLILSPFVPLSPGGLRNVRTNRDVYATAEFRAQYATKVIRSFGRHGITTNVLQQLANELLPDIMSTLVYSLSKRLEAIRYKLDANLLSPREGLDVPSAISAFKNVFNTVDDIFRQFSTYREGSWQTELVLQLISTLQWIFSRDDDLYERSSSVDRPAYPSDTMVGNPFRRFIQQGSGPLGFMQVLLNREPVLLRAHRGAIEQLINRYFSNGVGSSDGEQYNLVREALEEIHACST